MNNETWKDIPGYEGLYQVSDYGRVKSLKFRSVLREKLLKLQTDSKGYYFVCLWKDKKGKQKRVHQLVVLAFVGDYPPGTVLRMQQNQ